MMFVFSATKSLLLYQNCQKQKLLVGKSLFQLKIKELCRLKVNDIIGICSKLVSSKLLCKQLTEIDWQVLSN